MIKKLAPICLLICSTIVCYSVSELIFGRLNKSRFDHYVKEADSAMAKDVPPTIFKEMIFNSNFFQYHPVLGFTGIPFARQKFFNSEMKANSRGYRSREVTFEKPADVTRIILSGDSQVWGWELGDEDTLSENLLRVLQSKYSGKKFEVISHGITGYGIDQSYLQFLLEGARYHADYLFYVFFAENDYDDLTTHFSYNVERPLFYLMNDQLCLSNIPPPRAAGWTNNRLSEIFFRDRFYSGFKLKLAGRELELPRSETLTFFASRELSPSLLSVVDNSESKNWLGVLQPTDDPISLVRQRISCIQREPYDHPLTALDKRKLLLRVLSEFRSAVEQQGTKFVFIFKPRSNSAAKNDLEFDRKFLAELKKESYQVMDLRESINRAQVAEDQIFIAYNHLSPFGNAIASQAIVDAIIPR